MFFKKKKEESQQEFLVFDNYPFKLAVIQILMYDLKLVEKFHGGDDYFEKYKDVSNVSDEEAVKRLVPFIERADEFFREIKIPQELSKYIKGDILISENDEIYYQINPQFLDYDEYFSMEEFFIKDISEREISQFPHIKSITFNMGTEIPQSLAEKLRGLGIEVNTED